MALLLAGAVVTSLAGCQKPEEIVPYTVAKPPAQQGKPASAAQEWVDEADGTDQLIGAIIPHGEKTWYFKLTGPRAAVNLQRGPFVDFVKSLRFSEKGPEWTLPEGWSQEPGSGMRFATLRISTTEKPLELTVIALGSSEGDEFLLLNVNRWREQMTLAPISIKELPVKIIELELDDAKAKLVSFTGKLKPQPAMGMPPGNEGPSRAGAKEPAAAHGQPALPFTSQVPEGWRVAQANAMQLAAYEVGDKDRNVVISVSIAGGNLVQNLNRWREQVGLGELDADALAEAAHPVKVDGADGIEVEFVGPADAEKPKSVVGVIVDVQGRQWFIKLIGIPELVAQEKSHFEEFVKSIRFRAAN